MKSVKVLLSYTLEGEIETEVLVEDNATDDDIRATAEEAFDNFSQSHLVKNLDRYGGGVTLTSVMDFDGNELI